MNEAKLPVRFDTYDPEDFYDELFTQKGQPRPAVVPLMERISSLPPESPTTPAGSSADAL